MDWFRNLSVYLAASTSYCASQTPQIEGSRNSTAANQVLIIHAINLPRGRERQRKSSSSSYVGRVVVIVNCGDQREIRTLCSGDDGMRWGERFSTFSSSRTLFSPSTEVYSPRVTFSSNTTASLPPSSKYRHTTRRRSLHFNWSLTSIAYLRYDDNIPVLKLEEELQALFVRSELEATR